MAGGTRDWNAQRRLFPALKHVAYLDHARVGPTSTRVQAAVTQAIVAQTEFGLNATTGLEARVEEIRDAVARLVGGSADGIAFTQNTSMGMAIVANGIDWRPGDNVVLPSDEFPSNFYPWSTLASRGVEVRLVDRDENGSASEAAADRVDDRTRVVAISAVQFSNGYRHDLSPIVSACADRRALLVVDGTQAAGAMKVDVTVEGIDVLAVAGHKWMLSPLGTGFAHFSPRALKTLSVSMPGWMSVKNPFAFDYRPDWHSTARRFEPGTESFIGVHGLGAATDLFLELGVDEIQRRILDLGAVLVKEVDTLGLRLLSTRQEGRRSGISIVAHPEEDVARTHERLLSQGILCSLRGGGVRLSPHLYTTEEELVQAIDCMARR